MVIRDKYSNYQSDAALYDVDTDSVSDSGKGNILVQESGVLEKFKKERKESNSEPLFLFFLYRKLSNLHILQKM